MLAFIRLDVFWPRARAMVSDYASISRNDFLDLGTPLTIKWFINNIVIRNEDITNCQKIKKQNIYLKLNNPSSHSTPGSELQDQQPQFDFCLLSSPHMQSFYLCFHKEAQIKQKHDLHQFPEQKKKNNGVTGLHIKSVFKNLQSTRRDLWSGGGATACGEGTVSEWLFFHSCSMITHLCPTLETRWGEWRASISHFTQGEGSEKGWLLDSYCQFGNKLLPRNQYS